MFNRGLLIFLIVCGMSFADVAIEGVQTVSPQFLPPIKGIDSTPRIAVIRAEQPRRNTSKLWMISVAGLVGASAFDAASSWGKYESNPLLRSRSGQFGAKGLGLKTASIGAVILPQVLFHKRYGLEKTFSVLNFSLAGMYSGLAIHNLGISAAR
jgi:hypothetical protein